jgi:hypothetical protein
MDDQTGRPPAGAHGEEEGKAGAGDARSTPGAGLRRELVDGLLYVHSRLSAYTSEMLEAASFIGALVEVLKARGLITPEEIEKQKQIVGQRLAEQLDARGIGIMINPLEEDKYAFEGGVEIDCANRVHLCRAACCRLPFALSRQDVREGTIRWNLSQPYMNVREQDTYCCHMDRGDFRCTVHGSRPVPCRFFDCRKDKRIWLDFEKKIPNPALERRDWPECLEHPTETPPGRQAGSPLDHRLA